MRWALLTTSGLLLILMLGCNKANQSSQQSSTARAPQSSQHATRPPQPAGEERSGAMSVAEGRDQESSGQMASIDGEAMLTHGIEIGEPAPQFTLPGYPQLEFNLADYRGRQAVVLYFYPKDGTPGCTKEACTFRDTAAQFADQNAAIVGISQDDLASHKQFAGEHSLPFPLLYDAGGKVRELFGNPDGSTPLIKRITYVIDKQGIVRDIINADGQAEVEDHISGALAAVTKLNEEESAAG